jgi:hypothetical protein
MDANFGEDAAGEIFNPPSLTGEVLAEVQERGEPIFNPQFAESRRLNAWGGLLASPACDPSFSF